MAKDLADDGSSSEFEEDLSLLHQERIVEIRYRNTFSWIILDLFLASGYVIGIGTIFLLNGSLFCRDPSLPIWCK
jgi:hypothetical protein